MAKGPMKAAELRTAPDLERAPEPTPEPASDGTTTAPDVIDATAASAADAAMDAALAEPAPDLTDLAALAEITFAAENMLETASELAEAARVVNANAAACREHDRALPPLAPLPATLEEAKAELEALTGGGDPLAWRGQMVDARNAAVEAAAELDAAARALKGAADAAMNRRADLVQHRSLVRRDALVRHVAKLEAAAG